MSHDEGGQEDVISNTVAVVVDGLQPLTVVGFLERIILVGYGKLTEAGMKKVGDYEYTKAIKPGEEISAKSYSTV